MSIAEYDPERLAKALEERADVTEQYDHVLWETARRNKLKRMFDSGQTRLNAFGYNIYYQGSADPVIEFQQPKTIQTRFKLIGGDNMTEEHDSLDYEVADRPEKETKKGEVVAIRTGARQEFYEPNEDGEYRYGDASDPMLQIVAEYEHDGATLQETFTFRDYDSPDPRSNLGKYVKRYGSPEKGQEVNIDFDENGYGSVVLP